MFTKTRKKLVSVIEEFVSQLQEENDFPWSLSVEKDNISDLEVDNILHDMGVEGKNDEY